jgi:hypothetical protein
LAQGQVDPLKYQQDRTVVGGDHDEWMTVKLRYKDPEAQTSRLIRQAVPIRETSFARATQDFRFAASVAAFGMLLRKSEHCGDANLDAVLEIASAAQGGDRHGHRREFLELVQTARRLMGLVETPIGGRIVPLHVGGRVRTVRIVPQPYPVSPVPTWPQGLTWFMLAAVAYVVFSAVVSAFVLGAVVYSHWCRRPMMPQKQLGVPAIR